MITVFTPIYNRGYTIARLFESLQGQTSSDFEWVVVDDGSTDETPRLLVEFAEKANFPFRYERQNNSGKHIAMNRGAELAQGEWFFVVDSDDWLPSDSIEINLRYIAQIASDDSFAGVSGVCARPDGALLLVDSEMSLDVLGPEVRNRFAREFIDATPKDYRFKFKMPGDRAEIVRTELIRRFPFPHFEGEWFVSEFFLWQSISELGLKIRWFNTPTYCGDYLEDGLTTNMKSVMLENPKGRAFVDNFTLQAHVPINMKLRSAVNYIRYGRYAGYRIGSLLTDSNRPLMVLLAMPVALLFPLSPGDGVE